MNTQQANTAFGIIVKAICERNARVYSKDNDLTVEFLAKSEKGIKAGMMKFALEVIESWARMQTSDKKGDAGFIAVKANYKIARLLYAIGAKLVSAIDDYSASIIANMLANGGVIFAKTALMSLCKDLEYNALEQTQVIKARMGKALSTASTQRSSTREALRVLGLAEVHKGVKEDPATATAKGRSILEPMFA